MRDGAEMRVEDDDQAFAAATVAVLRSPGGLGDAGRQYVIAHHDWDAVVGAYEAVYQQLINELEAEDGSTPSALD